MMNQSEGSVEISGERVRFPLFWIGTINTWCRPIISRTGIQRQNTTRLYSWRCCIRNQAGPMVYTPACGRNFCV